MIICGFPGIGKTFTVQNWIYSNIKIYDSDSSNFSWIDKNDHSKGHNPDFPANYIEYIKSIDNENSVVRIKKCGMPLKPQELTITLCTPIWKVLAKIFI